MVAGGLVGSRQKRSRRHGVQTGHGLPVLAGLYFAQAIPTSLFVTAIPPILRYEGSDPDRARRAGPAGDPRCAEVPVGAAGRPAAACRPGAPAGWIVLTQIGKSA
jgi:hypothetical protein